VYTVTSYRVSDNGSNMDLWMVATKGGEPVQLTNFEGYESNARWSPQSDKIAFVSDHTGADQIFTMDIATKQIQQVSNLPIGPNEFGWTCDGQYFLIVASVYPGKTMAETAQLDAEKKQSKVKARVIDSLMYRHWNQWVDGKVTHLFVMPAAGGEVKDLTPGPHFAPPIALGGERDYSYCPKSKTVFYTTNTDAMLATSTNNDIFCVSVDSGKPERITSNPANDNSPVVSPDSRYLAYLSMARANFEADELDLMVLDFETKQVRNLTADFDRDVGYPVFGGEYIYFWTFSLGRSVAYRVKIAGGPVEQLIGEHSNRALQVSADGQTLVFLRESVALPTEIFTANSDGTNVQQITFTNQKLIEPIQFQPVEDFWFESFDGWRVHGLIVKPPFFDANKKYPVIFLIHGGPQGDFSDEFHYRWNLSMFAAPGYVVLAINFRGSKGYGQKFCDAVTGDWGGAPYQDLMTGLDIALAKYPYMDSERVAAAGASYGGFMVNWIAGHTNRFACLISHAGLFELHSKYGSTEELWFPEWEFRGTPYHNPELYDRFSPCRYAKNFVTPTMVVHGELDFRVPVAQGFAMFTALQRQGIPSRLLYFPDEGHFVSKPQNARLWWQQVYGWLNQWLK